MKGFLSVLLVVAVLGGAHAKQRKSGNECPKEQENNWEVELLLSHEDCDKFYKCTYGKPVEQHCPEGLFFNIEKSQCDWQDHVDCSDRNVPGGDEGETTEEGSESDNPKPDSEEKDKDDKDDKEDKDTDEDSATSESEPDVTTTEAEESNVTESEESETTVAAPDSLEPSSDESGSESSDIGPTESPEGEFLPNGCPADPHVHWLLPHESDCNQFYYCVWGEKVLRTCSASLHFNKKLQVCDWPQDAGCILSANKHHDVRSSLYKKYNKPL